MIPLSPTNPAVLQDAMRNGLQLTKELGHEWTIIAEDQATHELAYTIWMKTSELSNVVLVLGGFHLAFNFLKAIVKIIRDAGVEQLLVTAGLFTEGVAKMHLIKRLSTTKDSML